MRPIKNIVRCRKQDCSNFSIPITQCTVAKWVEGKRGSMSPSFDLYCTLKKDFCYNLWEKEEV